MDERQLEQFEGAVEEKKRKSKEASERTPPPQTGGGGAIEGDEESLIEHGRPQDVRDERKKNAGHGKKTADKWNQ